MTAPPKTRSNSTISSIEARRIIAVLEDTRQRIEYALLLPSLSDFLDGKELDEEIQAAHLEFMTHQHNITSLITSEGEPKPGCQIEYEEEVQLYKASARLLVRVMKQHQDFFAPLLQQSSNMGGSAVTLNKVIVDLNNTMHVTFSTPVEMEEQQKKMLQEVQQRQKSNLDEYHELDIGEQSIIKERDSKVRTKQELLDEIVQQLTAAKITEQSLKEDEFNIDETPADDEALKKQLQESKSELTFLQKKNSEDENRTRRLIRKDEEALQALIQKYDAEMVDYEAKIRVARIEAEKREKIYNELREEHEKIEAQRTPLRNEENLQSDKTLRNFKKHQAFVAAATELQIEIRNFLKTAPKIPKKGKKGGKKKKK